MAAGRSISQRAPTTAMASGVRRDGGRHRAQAAGAVLMAVLVATVFAAFVYALVTSIDTSRLRDAVTVAGIREHQRALQTIADEHSGTRAVSTPGYQASVDYVRGRLLAAGYQVDIQQFVIPLFQEQTPPRLGRTAPNAVSYSERTDVRVLTYSGSGDVTAPVQAVDLPAPITPRPRSSSGCEPADFVGFTPGNVALMQRGACPLADQARNARAAEASAVLIRNEGEPGHENAVRGSLGQPGIAIPVLGVSSAAGAELARTPGAPVHVAVQAELRFVETANILADTPGGRDDRVVVVGAHLDSVPEGPGINDNGSGVGTVLEIAEQFAALRIEPRNKVRFAFWGAEEPGLFGSWFYVKHLSPEQLSDIMVDLNFDMLGSPNFVRLVYDGDGSTGPPRPPRGSDEVERMFLEYFARARLPVEPYAFDGRSDYDAFLSAGIPAGVIFSGAEGVKTPEQAAVFGGTAGAPYDSCYHQACDTADNVSEVALDQLSDGAADAVLRLAQQAADVRES